MADEANQVKQACNNTHKLNHTREENRKSHTTTKQICKTNLPKLKQNIILKAS